MFPVLQVRLSTCYRGNLWAIQFPIKLYAKYKMQDPVNRKALDYISLMDRGNVELPVTVADD